MDRNSSGGDEAELELDPAELVIVGQVFRVRYQHPRLLDRLAVGPASIHST